MVDHDANASLTVTGPKNYRTGHGLALIGAVLLGKFQDDPKLFSQRSCATDVC